MKKREYSYTDVALEAKVHRNTVYSYMRGLGVTDDSRGKIEAAVKKLESKAQKTA